MKMAERIVRIVLAFVIFGIGFYFESLWGLLGLIPLLTGMVGVCPLRVLANKQACPLKSSASKKEKE